MAIVYTWNGSDPFHRDFTLTSRSDWARLDEIVHAIMNSGQRSGSAHTYASYPDEINLDRMYFADLPLYSHSNSEQPMYAQDIVQNDSLLAEVLNSLLSLVDYEAKNNSIWINRPDTNGQFEVAKITRSASSTKVNSLGPVFKVSFKPKGYLDKSIRNFSWNYYGDGFEIPNDLVTKKREMESLEALTKLLSVYSMAMPKFVEKNSKYINDVDEFIKDFQFIVDMDEAILEELVDTLGIEISHEDNIEAELLEVLLFEFEGPNLSEAVDWINANFDKDWNRIPQPQTTQTNNTKTYTGETTMPTEKSGREFMVASLKKGAATGAVGAINRKAVDTFIEQLGDKCPDMFKTEAGRKALQGLVPFAVLLAMDYDVNGRIPKQMSVPARKLAEHAWDSFTQETAGDVVEAALDVFLPLLQQYMSAGQSLLSPEELAALNEEEDLLTSPPVKQTAKAL